LKDWLERPTEIRNLFNPAFCGLTLLHAIHGYMEEVEEGMPFSISLLVLPNILNPISRKAILNNNRRYLLKIIEKEPEMLIEFSKRTNYLIPFTLEGLGVAFQYNCIVVTDSGALKIRPRSYLKKLIGSPETKECLKAARLLGKKFSNINDRATIYTSFGVRP